MPVVASFLVTVFEGVNANCPSLVYRKSMEKYGTPFFAFQNLLKNTNS